MKKIITIVLAIIFVAMCVSCASGAAEKPSKNSPTDLAWNFGTLPTGWADKKLCSKGSDVPYLDGMTILSSQQQMKMDLIHEPPTLETTFSNGFLQTTAAGDVLKIDGIVGPATIMVYYTGAGNGDNNKVSIKIDGTEVICGENSPNTKTETVVKANYDGSTPAQVTISCGNALRIFDVMIFPSEI